VKEAGMMQVIVYNPGANCREWVMELARFSFVENILILSEESRGPWPGKCGLVKGRIGNGQILNAVIEKFSADYILWLDGSREIAIQERELHRLMAIADITEAGLVYCDYFVRDGEALSRHPLNDYQLGSIRDDFEFGSAMLFSLQAIQDSLDRFGSVPDLRWAGFYDLRLKVSIDYEIFHIPECLYTVAERPGAEAAGESLFDYVKPAHRAIQVEMEEVATSYLKHIGAYLEPAFQRADLSRKDYPVEASVIIPVRNRVRTVQEAVMSALEQKTDFPFNILVVDNHSDDGTTDLLAGITLEHSSIRHIIPKRIDLGIGGCWNEALFSDDCGRYAVQLDSDDLYSGHHSLQSLVDLLRSGDYGMAIGSYTLVDSELKTLPPGLIDHREWTDLNGRNNALRINGLGAPRAFVTELIRKKGGFLNVSYGEDYAVALAISRDFRIGRIYENLYLCRRWEDNTDSQLSVEQKNRNDYFKDTIRTLEIRARRKRCHQPVPA
jgi:hypothetical protein